MRERPKFTYLKNNLIYYLSKDTSKYGKVISTLNIRYNKFQQDYILTLFYNFYEKLINNTILPITYKYSTLKKDENNKINRPKWMRK